LYKNCKKYINHIFILQNNSLISSKVATFYNYKQIRFKMFDLYEDLTDYNLYVLTNKKISVYIIQLSYAIQNMKQK